MNKAENRVIFFLIGLYLMVSIGGLIYSHIIGNKTKQHQLEALEWRYQYQKNSIKRLSANMKWSTEQSRKSAEWKSKQEEKK